MSETLYRLKPLVWDQNKYCIFCAHTLGHITITNSKKHQKFKLDAEFISDAVICDSIDAAKLSAERIVAERVAEFMEVVR